MGTCALKQYPEGPVSYPLEGNHSSQPHLSDPILLLIYRQTLVGRGGSEKNMHTNHLSENTPPYLGICDDPIWPTIVGGYMKGRKKSQVKKIN